MPSQEDLPIYPDLRGKVALVTGIGQDGPADETNNWGNGAAISLALARNGVKIFGCDINIEAGLRTKSRILALVSDATVDVVSTDVTSSAAVSDLVSQALQKHSGRIDILVNNVGRSEKGGPADMSEAVWDAQVAINLKSVYLLCHAVLPVMERQRSGSVVNISSIASVRYIGKPQVAYAATKAAVTQFTKHTAVVYADKGVRLNAVLPGLMFTPLVHTIAQKYADGDYDGFVATRHAQVPTGRMGTSLDVANAVVFLSSNVAARYVTGQKLVVDGAIISSTGRT
jgi:NAD(P)-dependent dehydrogenase (short-subunit alcohol dehydrogenase family)